MISHHRGAEKNSTLMKIQPTIGLLGGTFDPIHFAHLRMAEELAEALRLDEVRFIPAATPPHKHPPVASMEHRAAMVRLGIAANPRFTFDERELHRVGASYSVDTLQSLRQELGVEASLVLFIGSDAFSQLHTWHRWEELISLCHIAVAQRPSVSGEEPFPIVMDSFLRTHRTEDIDDLHRFPAGFVTMQHITALDISSTKIRQALHAQGSVRYLMPESVADYIREHRLY